MFPKQQPPSLLAALAGAAVNASSNALEGFARKQQAAQGMHEGPGCTPCAAMARRRKAAAYVSSLGGKRR